MGSATASNFINNMPSAISDKAIVNLWNQTEVDYSCDKTFSQLFEEQATKSPDGISVVYGNEKVTYQELNEKANQLARYIRKHYQVTTNEELISDTLIGLCFDRGINMIIAILGVLKAGGAYIPIDPNYPKERISFILDDTKCRLLLTQAHLQNILNKILTSGVSAIAVDSECFAEEEVANLKSYSQANDLAYVIYTSGTTGRPKGVMINQSAFSLFLQGFKNKFMQGNANVLSLTYYTFDIFGLEYGLPLISGNTLILSDVNQFRNDFLKHKDNIQLIQQTPSVLHSVIDELPSPLIPFNITCLVGGEAVSKQLMSRLNIIFKRVINVYGPTETTIWSTAYSSKNGQNYIGKPLDNEKTYILDKNLSSVEVGVVGELHIGGSGLARGYLNLLEQTEERFITNPFATESDKRKGYTRLYKTGDLAKYLPDGNIEFLGRNDFQVKIRGHRIELGEIESAFSALTDIKQCVVISQKKDDSVSSEYLVAYYVTDMEIESKLITETLTTYLPEYMVPSVFMHLEKLPLTANGKLDRKSLPKPEFNNHEDYVAPGNDLEAKLCQLWEKMLGVLRIGINDDFFSLGGHSVLAIRCVHHMSEILGFQINIADIFAQKTIANLLKNSKYSENIIIPQTKADRSALSFAQERLWFIEQYEAGTNAYHLPMLFELSVNVDKDALTRALKSVIARHDILRTCFYQDAQGRDCQIITEKEILISSHVFNDENAYQTQLAEDINTPFDLRNGLPVRACYYDLSATNKRYLLINIHHIAFDGWSIDIFIKELLHYYHKRESLSLEPLGIQYKDYAIWQRNYLSGEVINTQLNYWQDKLEGYEILHLPTDKPRPVKINYQGETASFKLSKSLSRKLRILAKDNGCSLYTILLSGFYAFIYHYTGQSDIVIGTPVANRHYPQIQDLIGFFVNSIALRAKFNPEQDSFHSLIKKVQSDLVDAQRYQDIPFEKLVNHLGVERDASRHPIFQIMFGVQSFDKWQDNNEYDSIQSVNLDHLYTAAKFDLSLFIDDGHETLAGTLNYAVSLFNHETITRMIGHYERILEILVANNKKLISDTSVLTSAEYQKIVYDWNQTDINYADNITVTQLFEVQAAKTPEKTALIFENEKLTYKQLNDKANQLARYLRKKYEETNNEIFKSGSLIGICLNRSIDMIVAILAVLKTGGAYVPIDPKYPSERIQFILNDALPSLLITETHLKNSLAALHANQTILLSIDNAPYIEESIDGLEEINTAKDLAYVIYTSGTTGKPKGVMLNHQGVINMVGAQHKEFSVNSSAVVLQFASIVFDASVWEIFNALTCGARLVIASEMLRRDPEKLIEYMAEEQVSLATLPPALLSQASYYQLPQLKNLVVAGESCDPQTMATWSEGRDFVNAYGPTETTVCATLHHYKLGDSATVIGRPLQNMRAYILNAYKKPVPVGVIGELYIGGAGLAVGYLNRPDLTDERFTQNLFANQQDIDKGYSRLYKTGDLARYLPDGNIEYIGRNDFQVKIRGYRIELGEIENILLEQDGINKCVVLVVNRDNGGKHTQQLVAYYVADVVLDEVELREKIASRLPEYMLPNAFVHLNEFPLTINGKLDTRLFPKPAFSASKREYVAPGNEIETALCKIWQELLGLEKVGINDDFFCRGGSSILAIQLVARISQLLKMTIAIADIFTYKTISKLATHLRHDTTKSIVAEEVDKSPLSFSQESLWFVEQYEEGSNVYHIPMLFDLKQETNLDHLSSAIQAIIDRHKILRTTISQTDDGVNYQQVQDAQLYVSSYNFETEEAYRAQRDNDVNMPFDLRNELPIRASYYNITGNNGNFDRKILINVHHIAFDGWSTAIFLQELDHFYQYYNGGSVIDLPTLDIQYKDYASWQRKLATSDELTNQIAYWKENLKGAELLNFPLDKARPSKRDYLGANIEFSLSNEVSTKIRNLAKRKGYSLYTMLLAGFYLLLHKYSGQNDLVVGTPSANRHHPQIQELIGFFVNSLVLRANVPSEITIDALLEKVNNVVIQAQRHQDVSFDQLVSHLEIERDTSRHPLFQIMFSMQSFGNEQSDGSASTWRASNKNVIENGTAKFDLLMVLDDDSNSNLTGYLNYATSLFETDTIERLVGHYEAIIKIIIQDSNDCISRISLLTSEERQQLLYNWNQTDVNYDSNKNLAQKFEEQVLKTPNNIALDFEGVELTYLELNQKANQLARHIRLKYQENTGKEIIPDTLIALYFERSIEMLVAILAVLKAGAAYVPLSPEHPLTRIQSLFEDCGAELVLTQSMLQPVLLRLKNISELLVVDTANYHIEDDSNLHIYSYPESLACVLYTSGTTGIPKGVLMEHKNVINHIEWLQSKFHLTENDAVIQKAAYIYDASVRELLWANWYGAKTIIAKPEGQKDSAYLYGLITKHSIKMIHFIPTMLEAFLIHIESTGKKLPESIRFMVCGGEMLKESLVEKCYKVSQHKNFLLYNVYGPTETTINVTHALRHKQRAGVIGRPNHNTRTYILDANLHPVPVGVVGELYIGGAGVTRGYLNREELTNERFITSPFATESDKEKGYTKLYKTGDLARILQDGNIECMGRNDYQVKIRGYRIELGEIEKALSSLDHIKQSVVVVHSRENSDGSNQYLVAYYVASQPISNDKIIDALSKDFPDYMIPSVFVHLQELPFSVTGKLDRNVLPKPDFNILTKEYTKPGNELEAKLCEIWEELLQIERIGIDDDFFYLGGNSILTIQLLARIIKHFNVSINLKDIFENRTVKNIAKRIEEANFTYSAYTTPIVTRESLPSLSYQQKLILDYIRHNPQSTLFQSGVALIINENINPDNFKNGVKATLEEFPLFRTRFNLKGDEYSPVISDINSIDLSSVFSFEECYIDNHEDQKKYAEIQRLEMAQRIFDYENNFLYVLKLIKVSEHRSILICFMSRLLADGYSLSMFIKSLFKNHAAIRDRKTINPIKAFDYFDYAEWQRKSFNKKLILNNLEYWQDQKLNEPKRELLSLDKIRVDILDGLCECERQQVDLYTTGKIRGFSKKNNISAYSIFFGAWAIYLFERSKQNDINIACVHRNRNKMEFEAIQGPFSDYLPIRIKDCPDYRAEKINFFKYIDNLIRDGLDHAVPYSLLLDELDVKKEDKLRYCNFPFTQTAVNFPSPYVKSSNNSENKSTSFEFTENTKHTTSFEVSVVIGETEQSYSISLNYRDELFNKETMTDVLKEYISLINRMVL